MKTSNKILIGVVVVILVIISGVHLALTQRYNSGQFTSSTNGSAKDSIVLKPVKFVKLNGLDNITLVPSHSYQLEVEKNMPAYFRYYISGDTLVVTGDTALKNGSNNGTRRRVYQEISLHIPGVTMIRAENTSIGITGKLDSAEVGTTRLDLIQSRLTFKNHVRVTDSAQYFGDVFISARQHSEVELSANTVHFNTLSCDLLKSTFRDNEMGDIKKFAITTDDSSSVQIGGINFQKLNTASKE